VERGFCFEGGFISNSVIFSTEPTYSAGGGESERKAQFGKKVRKTAWCAVKRANWGERKGGPHPLKKKRLFIA